MELHGSIMTKLLCLKYEEQLLKLLGGKEMEEEGEAGNGQYSDWKNLI